MCIVIYILSDLTLHNILHDRTAIFLNKLRKQLLDFVILLLFLVLTAIVLLLLLLVVLLGRIMLLLVATMGLTTMPSILHRWLGLQWWHVCYIVALEIDVQSTCVLLRLILESKLPAEILDGWFEFRDMAYAVITLSNDPVSIETTGQLIYYARRLLWICER